MYRHTRTTDLRTGLILPKMSQNLHILFKIIVSENSLLRTTQIMLRSQLHSKLLALSALFSVAVLIGIAGGLPLLLISAVVSITAAALFTGQSTNQIINRLSSSKGRRKTLFVMLAIVLGVSLLAHGVPAHAQLFDGARDAADSGIGTYIGTEESSSIIDILTFAMWALVVVGALAAIAGGVSQSVQVLVGGLTLFFGMAILIGVLEFTDGLLFGS